jgi:hypothetical protein
MNAIRIVALVIVVGAGIDGWRRILRPARGQVRPGWVGADAAALLLGSVIGLLARFPSILWAVLGIVTLPVFGYIWTWPIDLSSRRRRPPPSQPPFEEAVRLSRLVAWANLLSAAVFLLAGAAGLAWDAVSIGIRALLVAVLALMCAALGVLIARIRKALRRLLSRD